MGIILRNNKTITPSIVIEKSDEWQPDADMVWAKSICENDVQEGFSKKYLEMLDDGQEITNISIPQNGAVKTSDGSYYTYATSGSSISHTWDDSNSKQSEVGNYKVRWIIYYISLNIPISVTFTIRVLYACIDNLIISVRSGTYNMLQFIELTNGSSFSTSDSILLYNMKNLKCAQVIGAPTDCYRMLDGLPKLEKVDISGLNTSNTTHMQDMFEGIFETLDVSNLDTSKVTVMNQMFSSCTGLTKLDLSNFDTSNVTKMGSMFNNCINLSELDLSNFDTSNVTDMDNMFNGCYALRKIKGLSASKVVNIQYMFSGCYSLEELDLSNFDTSNVTNMNSVFRWCNIPKLDLTKWNTSNVRNMEFMFSIMNCITELDLSNFDTSNVTDMHEMFNHSNALTIVKGLENWNTSKVTNMRGMFYSTSIEKVTLTNSSKVTNMYQMFYNCKNLKTVSLDMTSVTNTYQMFQNCVNLEFLTLTNIKKDIGISSSTKYSRETLLGIINNLVDLTGQTAQTLTMGSTNLVKLTNKDKQIATNKNWSIQ